MAAGGFQPVQHLLHGLEAGVNGQQTFLLERFGDFLNQFAPASRGVGQRRQHPDGRSLKRQNAEQFNAVTGCAFKEEVLCQPTLGGVDAFHLSNFLDQEAQGDVDHRPI